MPSTHAHPRPLINRITQYGAAVLIVVMVAATVGQLVAAVADERARLLALSAIMTFLLTLPVIMLTTINPTVTVSPDSLLIQPLIWPHVRLPWSAVTAIKAYPLLPPPEAESGRRLLVGRKAYRAAEGRMLVIPSLPLLYRINGLFCGEGWTPVIGLTNRAHSDYPRLIKKVMIYYEGGA